MKRLKNIDEVKQDTLYEIGPGFMLWKTELNKELLSFWKSMTEGDQEQKEYQ